MRGSARHRIVDCLYEVVYPKPGDAKSNRLTLAPAATETPPKLAAKKCLHFAHVGVASASAVTNGSFESQNLSESYVGFLYSDAGFNQSLGYGPVGVSAPGWSFSGQSGLSYSNTEWGGTAQDGDVFGFLRNEGGEISQSFTDVAGDYAFSFNLAQRTSWRVGGVQTVSVLFDGAAVWSGTPGDTWSAYSFSASNVAAGSHTFSLRGTNLSAASDTSVFVDNVRLTVSAVPEPESYALVMVGLAMIGAVARRRKVNDA